MLAAGRVGLLFGDDGLGALLRVRDDVKSRRLGEKKKKMCSTHLHCSTNKSNNNIKRTPARLGARTTPVVGTTSAFKVAGVTMTALVGAAKGAERGKNDGGETGKHPNILRRGETSCVCTTSAGYSDKANLPFCGSGFT